MPAYGSYSYVLAYLFVAVVVSLCLLIVLSVRALRRGGSQNEAPPPAVPPAGPTIVNIKWRINE